MNKNVVGWFEIPTEDMERAMRFYRDVFKSLSSASASRDLKKGIELNLFTRSGDKNQTVYTVKR